MSEDDSEITLEPKKATDIAKLLGDALEPSRKIQAQLDKIAAPVKNPIFEDYLKQSSTFSNASKEAMKGITGNIDVLKNAASASTFANDAIKKAMGPSNLMAESIKNSFPKLSAIDQVIQGLDRQKALFGKLTEMPQIHTEQLAIPHIEPFEIPPNPIHETNDRLLELDERLQTMTSIMEEGLKIAAALQEAGLENAKSAIENAKTSRRTIWLTAIATIASIVALIMPFVQQAISAKETEKQQTLIREQVKKEFGELRASDQNSASKFTKTLEKSEENIVKAIQESKTKTVASASKK